MGQYRSVLAVMASIFSKHHCLESSGHLGFLLVNKNVFRHNGTVTVLVSISNIGQYFQYLSPRTGSHWSLDCATAQRVNVYPNTSLRPFAAWRLAVANFRTGCRLVGKLPRMRAMITLSFTPCRRRRTSH